MLGWWKLINSLRLLEQGTVDFVSEDNPDISISNMALAHNKPGITTEKCWGSFRVMPLKCHWQDFQGQTHR